MEPALMPLNQNLDPSRAPLEGCYSAHRSAETQLPVLASLLEPCQGVEGKTLLGTSPCGFLVRAKVSSHHPKRRPSPIVKLAAGVPILNVPPKRCAKHFKPHMKAIST